MALAVRTRTGPALIGGSLVAAIRAVDPEQPVYDARTLEAVVDRSMAERWLQTVLLGSFAVIAVLLASIGVYGVIAYAVGQRRREFGIRLALGARRSEIVGLVLRRGVLLFASGAVIGLAAAAASARVISSLLFNVSSFDLTSIGVSTVTLFIVAVAACALPARRAGSVDPSLALRAE
jgi:putative ABC transport system permease protein